MDGLAEIEGHSDQLVAAVKSLVDYRRRIASSDQPQVDVDSDKELNRAKASILAGAAGIRTLVGGPADFLQDLTRQVQILACLHWLADFQILACIPPDMSVPIKDLADLTGVPEAQLGRVIRLTATCGFLQEPTTSFVSHTPLSAQFMANRSLLDATMFMAESAIPAALQMPAATQQFGASSSPTESAYNLAMKTAQPFHASLQERPRLGRQWSAYLCHAAGLHEEEEVVDVLSRLNWSNLGNKCIVEVGARSTSMAQCLARRFPSLRLVVQIDNMQSSLHPDCGWQTEMMQNCVRDSEPQLESDRSSSSSSSASSPGARLTVSYRVTGIPQPVKDAAVYILHLPTSPDRALAVRAELQEYFGVLRLSGGVMLILTVHLLPEPGSLSDPKTEAVARARDLSMLQLANEGEMEMTELLSIIKTIRDSVGKLVVTNQLHSYNSLILALVVKYQAC